MYILYITEIRIIHHTLAETWNQLSAINHSGFGKYRITQSNLNMRVVFSLFLHLPSEGIHNQSQSFSFKTVTNKHLLHSVIDCMIYPHPNPSNTTPLHSTSKIEGLAQPVIGQCTHIYLTDIDRLEGGRGEVREREGGRGR